MPIAVVDPVVTPEYTLDVTSIVSMFFCVGVDVGFNVVFN